MRKISLDVDALRVESFDTSPDGAYGPRGTVHGRIEAIGGVVVEPLSQQCGTYPNCPSPLCMDTPLASCDGSCAWTCGASCNGTCASCATCNTCQESCRGTCGACIPPDPQIG
jgi:hypothetical protein